MSFSHLVFILVTDEHIAVEYLLGQTNRGDLLAPSHVPEIPSQGLEEDEEEEVEEVEEAEGTIHMSELVASDLPTTAEDQLLEGDTEPGVLVTEVSITFSNTLLKILTCSTTQYLPEVHVVIF